MLCSKFVSYWCSHTRWSISDEREDDRNYTERDVFYASNGRLESFKTTYKIPGTITVISREAGAILITTVKAWMERVPHLVKWYFRTLPQKGLVEKEEKGRGGKQSKKQCTVALFVAANGSKVFDPILVWKFQKSRCFAKLKNIYHPHGVHCFVNAKVWIAKLK